MLNDQEIDNVFKQNNSIYFINNINKFTEKLTQNIINHAAFHSEFDFIQNILNITKYDIKFSIEELINFNYARKTKAINILIKNRKIDDTCFDHFLMSILDNENHIDSATYIFSGLDHTNLQRLRYSNPPIFDKYKNRIETQKIKKNIEKF